MISRNFTSRSQVQNHPLHKNSPLEKDYLLITIPESKKKVPQLTEKSLSVWFLLTGIFAGIGALYRWGDGPLFPAPPGTDLGLYLSDLLIAAPVSIVASIGYYKRKKWGMFSGIFAAGVYIYGSAMVYIQVFQEGLPYPLKLIIPPIFGIAFSVIVILWTWHHMEVFLQSDTLNR